MDEAVVSCRNLVERLGGHPSARLGLDLGTEAGAGRWLAVACLLGARAPERRALEAARALADAGLLDPAALAKASPVQVEAVLAGTAYPKPAAIAARLARAARALAERHGGGLGGLAAEADGAEELAARLGALAPGIGPATVTRFLRPLRDHWPAAAEVPLARPARAAALHLGLLSEGEDEEGEPGALRAALAREPDAPSLADTEAALTRLGERACLRNRPDLCPLTPACPALR